MNQISPTAWVFLICLGIFVVAINLSLLIFLRNRSALRDNPRIRRSTDRARQVAQSFQNPWKNEDAQWQELSKRVHELKETPTETKPDDSSIDK